MPRGITANGKRRTKAQMMAFRKGLTVTPVIQRPLETEADVLVKLTDRFDAMHLMSLATATGKNRSLIISGPAGLGKSHGVMQVTEGLDTKGYQTRVVRGFVRPTGLYKTLYDFRHKNCVIVFDDADSVFGDDVSLNLLKTACDMTKSRVLSWLTESKMEDEEGERLPRSFEFEGSIIFITNYDFDAMIQAGTKLAPHFEAMISRSHYLDLAMHTKLDYIVRIKQVLALGMLSAEGFSKSQENEVLNFVVKYQETLRELSLRMVLKLAGLLKMNPRGWEKLALVTCMR